MGRDEFNIFVPTLINFNLIDSYAEKIISLRRDIEELDDRNEIDVTVKFKIISTNETLNTQISLTRLR